MQAFRLFAVNSDILFRFGFIFYKYAFLIKFLFQRLIANKLSQKNIYISRAELYAKNDLIARLMQ